MKRIILTIVPVIARIGGWMAYRFFFTLAHIPEAYAAWDTGTLIVAYMKAHENRWPASWDDLLTVLDSEAGRRIPLRGAQAGDVQYARSLSGKVAVDWSFNPARPQSQRPVTRLDGGDFPVTWQDPNEMIRDYLAGRPATRAAGGQ